MHKIKRVVSLKSLVSSVPTEIRRHPPVTGTNLITPHSKHALLSPRVERGQDRGTRGRSSVVYHQVCFSTRRHLAPMRQRHPAVKGCDGRGWYSWWSSLMVQKGARPWDQMSALSVQGRFSMTSGLLSLYNPHSLSTLNTLPVH